MSLNNTIIDNSTDELSMRETLKECLTNKDFAELKIATAYWDIPGMVLILEELKEFLEKANSKFYLLIGKEPTITIAQQKKPEYAKVDDPKEYIIKHITNLELKDEYQEVIELIIEHLKNGKIEIKLYGYEPENPQFLHSKCYIFKGTNKAYGIIGSSNFTQKGLEGNAELNYLETTPHIVKYGVEGSIKGHIGWFNEKWKQSEEWSKKFYQMLLQTPIGQKVLEEINAPKKNDFLLSPYEIYIKILQDKYKDIIDDVNKQTLINYLPEGIEPFDYQIEAVTWCYKTMKKHNGFFLGDVVGLGKTIVAVLLIKHFINSEKNNRKVLIVTPTAIKSNWEDTIKMFDERQRDNDKIKIKPFIDLITIGSIGKMIECDEDIISEVDSDIFDIEPQKLNYGLIIIDESHNFRNSNNAKYENINKLINNIRKEVGKYPYVGMLSATIQNNSPEDIKNQIYLFERTPEKSAFEKVDKKNISKFFDGVNKKYREIISAGDSEDAEPNKNDLIELSNEVRTKVLNDVLIRRTRTDVKKMPGNTLTFPEVIGPKRIEYKMDKELATLFYDTMNIIAPKNQDNNSDSLKYYRYRATEHLNEKFHTRYTGKNMTVQRSSEQLANIMQIMLVKRLESSFAAFKKSLENLKRYTENMIQMWKDDSIFICPDLNINDELLNKKSSYEAIQNKIKDLTDKGKNTKKQNAEYKQKDFNKNYIDLLNKDLKIIKGLVKRWNKNDYDPKLDVFKEKLTTEILNKETNKSQKLVIFSEAIDTVNVLKEALKKYNPLVITSANRKDCEQKIKENFDANYSGEHKNEHNIIITTEVLAEGINLHRANVILNYDTPWNATRLIQRIGRVNRIGSKYDKIYVYNFYPSAEGDKEINLVRNAYTKLQSFHTMFGEDYRIFSEEEELAEGNFYNKYIDGEESPEQEFINDLKEFKNTNKNRYDELLKIEDKTLQSARYNETNKSLFIVKNDNYPDGLNIIVDAKNESEQVSDIDMLKFSRCAINTNSVSLPENIKEQEESAIKCFNRSAHKFFGMEKRTNNKISKIIKEAQGIIYNLSNETNITLTQESKKLLEQVYEQVCNGDSGIAEYITPLQDEIDNLSKTNDINSISNEINEMITNHFNNFNNNSKKGKNKDSEPYVYISVSKIKK